MKKVIKLSLVLVTICMICMMGRVYAALSCNVTLSAPTTVVSKGKEFTIDASISNIQSDRGVIALGATLEYDKQSLTLVKMQGLNEWETPKEGKSYNSANGKLAIERDSVGKNNEVFLRLTFKVNDNSKQNLNVVLKDITVADGTTPAKLNQVSSNITVTEGTQNPDKPTVPDDTNKNNNVNNNGTTTNTVNNQNGSSTNNSNKNTGATGSTKTNTMQLSKDVAKDSALPKTGENNIVLISAIAILVVGAVIFFIKMKMTNSKK